MKFDGYVVVGNDKKPCHFEIGAPRKSTTTTAPYECPVSTTYPEAIATTAFGEDEKNAYQCAVAFLRQLFGTARLVNAAGAPVDWPDAPAQKEAGELPPEGQIGLVLSLLPVAGDKMRLRVDEVTRHGSGWNFYCVSTHVDYDRSVVVDLSLSQEQFAEIGFNLLLFLSRHHKQKL